MQAAEGHAALCSVGHGHKGFRIERPCLRILFWIVTHCFAVFFVNVASCRQAWAGTASWSRICFLVANINTKYDVGIGTDASLRKH